MARYGSKDVAFLLVDGYSILGAQTEIRDKKEAVFEDGHVLGDSWVKPAAVGLKRAEFIQDGFFDDAADGANAALVAGDGTTRVLCYGVAGNAKRRKFTGHGGAAQVDYERIASRGALHKAKASYLGSGAVDEGIILHEHAAEATASGNTRAASHDNAASSAGGGAGYLQVSALTLGGYTSLTVAIEHSADNVTFADLLTFTAVTAAPAAARVAVAGAINRYTAARWQFNGAGAGPAATFMAGLART